MMSAVGGTMPRRVTEDEDAVAAIMRRGGPALRARMVRTEQYLEHVTAAAGVPLAVHATATVVAGGKRLRPLLVVLACEAAGGPSIEATVGPRVEATAGPGIEVAAGPGTNGGPGGDRLERSFASAPEGEQRLVRAAVAIELVHSATLVHDDVIDGAELRRGHPTVVAGAGRDTAIATGDLLFSRAFAELARNDDLAQLRALSDASSALAAGELLQREDAYASRAAVERYLRRCELKTAALFEAACRLGALVATKAVGNRDSASAIADGLGAFARRIGLAFQLLDDVLDV